MHLLSFCFVPPGTYYRQDRLRFINLMERVLTACHYSFYLNQLRPNANKPAAEMKFVY